MSVSVPNRNFTPQSIIQRNKCRRVDEVMLRLSATNCFACSETKAERVHGWFIGWAGWLVYWLSWLLIGCLVGWLVGCWVVCGWLVGW